MLKCKFEGCERNFRYPVQQEKPCIFGKQKYYLDFFKDLSVQNNYHHLHKGNNCLFY